ncbi:hypothetical protein CEXT_255891 [Caerostris extrusa]|uniref:Uncharacterized protein n=1 Tax=Caerostris extrusa TaxID=172846 RepID=A0AAV4WIB0_CAEEX|nr:hypothetical protein CEXT_255891 [Caerostris extrusa]
MRRRVDVSPPPQLMVDPVPASPSPPPRRAGDSSPSAISTRSGDSYSGRYSPSLPSSRSSPARDESPPAGTAIQRNPASPSPRASPSPPASPPPYAGRTTRSGRYYPYRRPASSAAVPPPTTAAVPPPTTAAVPPPTTAPRPLPTPGPVTRCKTGSLPLRTSPSTSPESLATVRCRDQRPLLMAKCCPRALRSASTD